MAAGASITTSSATPSRRVEILDMAARLLNHQGVSQTSMQDLAVTMGVTRNALYHHFEDREALLFEVYMRSCELLGEHLAEARAAGGDCASVIARFMARVYDPAHPEPASMNEHGLLGPARLSALLARYEVLVGDLAGVLRQGARDGDLREADFETVARCLISILHWIPLGSRWAEASPQLRRRIIDLLQDLILRGWAADRARRANLVQVDTSPLLAPSADGFDREALDLRRRETILSGASRLFNFRGVGATKFEDIAATYGTSKQQLFRYVGNKRELVKACFGRSARIYGFIVMAARSRIAPTPEKLATIFYTNAIIQQHPELQPLHFATAVGSLDAADQALERARQQATAAEGLVLFEDGAREGSIRAFDLNVLINYIIGGANTWLVKRYVEADERRKLEMAATVCDVLRLGILAN